MTSGLGSFATSVWFWTLWYRVSHILNMAREIDNFFPERFTYHNVRVWDEESAQLLPHWKGTHRFIEHARLAPPSFCHHLSPIELAKPRLPVETGTLLLLILPVVLFPSLPSLVSLSFLCWVLSPYLPLPSLQATGVEGEWTDHIPPP